MEEELDYCDFCGYAMEWLCTCEYCGKRYCEYHSGRDESCCADCDTEGEEDEQ